MKREKFKVWSPEEAEECDAGTYEVLFGPGQAAEEWAARDDAESADYRIVSGDEAVVHVRSGSGMLTRWRVSGETVAAYHAAELGATDAE
tara:strand:+ start:2079 stop:2348 length:270 start_codon:yes stop_codon:yes gene_type:complete